MSMTPEKKVKKCVTDQLKKIGAYYFCPMSGGFGKSGVPDIIVCFRGYFVAIECKAGKNTTTKLQEMQLQEIREASGIAVVVNEDNMHNVTNLLQVLPTPEGHIDGSVRYTLY